MPVDAPGQPRALRGVKPGKAFGVGPRGASARAFASWYRDQSAACWQDLDMEAVARLARALETARARGRTVYTMGNGGSAATASHWATDLSKTAARPDKPALKCLSLSDNPSFLTAIGNDLGYDKLFSRQLENLLKAGDVVILISGSGNSPNLLEAARLARRRGALGVGLVGFDGGRLLKAVDLALWTRAEQYGVIEDAHMAIGHILTFYLRQSR